VQNSPWIYYIHDTYSTPQPLIPYKTVTPCLVSSPSHNPTTTTCLPPPPTTHHQLSGLVFCPQVKTSHQYDSVCLVIELLLTPASSNAVRNIYCGVCIASACCNLAMCIARFALRRTHPTSFVRSHPPRYMDYPDIPFQSQGHHWACWYASCCSIPPSSWC